MPKIQGREGKKKPSKPHNAYKLSIIVWILNIKVGSGKS